MKTRSIALRLGVTMLGMLALMTQPSAGAMEALPWSDAGFEAGLAPLGYDKCSDPDLTVGPFRIIPDQKYGLCFPGRCWLFDQVLYCACEKLPEDARTIAGESPLDYRDSISLPQNISDNDFYPDGGNVCNVMEDGNDKGYRVSTFSLSPANGIFEGDEGGVYVCPGNTAGSGSYAQCDGGLCFEGVSQMRGVEDLFNEQIICSCPIVTSCNNTMPYNIYGPMDPDEMDPHKCSAQDCETFCGAGNVPPRECGKGLGIGLANGTGPMIPIGAPLGSGRLLTCALLEFQGLPVEPFQECVCSYEPGKKGGDGKGSWSARSRTVEFPCGRSAALQ